MAPRPKRNNSTGTLKSRQEDLRDRSSSSHKKRSSVPTSPPPPPKERLFAGRKSKLASFSLSPNTRSLRLFKRSSTGSGKEESYPNDNGEQPKTPTKSSSRKSRFSLRAAYFTAPADRSNRKVNDDDNDDGDNRKSNGLYMPSLVDNEQETYELDVDDLEVLETPKPAGRRKTRASTRLPSNLYFSSPPDTTKAVRPKFDRIPSQSMMRAPMPYSMTRESMSPHTMRHSIRGGIEPPNLYQKSQSMHVPSTSSSSSDIKKPLNNTTTNTKSRRQQKLDDERQAAPEFTIGQLVVLEGLQNDEMNGRKGRVYGKKVNSDRYHIALFGQDIEIISPTTVPPLEEEDDYVAIRPKNLRVITWEEAAQPMIIRKVVTEEEEEEEEVPKKKKKKKKKKEESVVSEVATDDIDAKPAKKKKKKKKKKEQEHSVAKHDRSSAVMETCQEVFSADDDYSGLHHLEEDGETHEEEHGEMPLHDEYEVHDKDHPQRLSARSVTSSRPKLEPVPVDDFVIGEYVQLHGLKTESMNGREGFVYGMSEDRVFVVIDQVGDIDRNLKNFMQDEDYVAIRPENLIHLNMGQKKNIKPIISKKQTTNNLQAIPQSDSDYFSEDEVAEEVMGSTPTLCGSKASLKTFDSDWGSEDDLVDDEETNDGGYLMGDEASEMDSVDQDLDLEPAKVNDDESSEESSLEMASTDDDQNSDDESSAIEVGSDKASLARSLDVDHSDDEVSLTLEMIAETRTSEFSDPKTTPPTSDSSKKKSSSTKDTDETSITVDDIEEEEEEESIQLNYKEESSEEEDDDISVELKLGDAPKKVKPKEGEKSQVLDWYQCSKMLSIEMSEAESDSDDVENDSIETEIEMQSTSDESNGLHSKELRKSKQAEASSMRKSRFSLVSAIDNVKEAIQYEEMLRDLKKKGLSREIVCDIADDDCSEVTQSDQSYIMDLRSQLYQRDALRQEELLEMAFDLFQHLASREGGHFDGQSEELFLQIHQQVTEKHGPELKERDDAKDKRLRHYLAAVKNNKY